MIIVSDAELQIGPSIPIFGNYIDKFHAGGRAIMGLCIESDSEDSLSKSASVDIDKQKDKKRTVSIYMNAL